MKIVKNGQLVDFSFPVVVPEFSGATDNNDGEKGSVPAPKTTDKNKFLKGDGTWGSPADTKYDNATAAKSGLMSNTDKVKLDNINITFGTQDLEAGVSPLANGTIYLVYE